MPPRHRITNPCFFKLGELRISPVLVLGSPRSAQPRLPLRGCLRVTRSSQFGSGEVWGAFSNGLVTVFALIRNAQRATRLVNPLYKSALRHRTICRYRSCGLCALPSLNFCNWTSPLTPHHHTKSAV